MGVDGTKDQVDHVALAVFSELYITPKKSGNLLNGGNPIYS